MRSYLFVWLVGVVPCVAITGPSSAGSAYIMRNWARDQHAFLFSDFKDAFKGNWKHALVSSVLTCSSCVVCSWVSVGASVVISGACVVGASVDCVTSADELSHDASIMLQSRTAASAHNTDWAFLFCIGVLTTFLKLLLISYNNARKLSTTFDNSPPKGCIAGASVL